MALRLTAKDMHEHQYCSGCGLPRTQCSPRLCRVCRLPLGIVADDVCPACVHELRELTGRVS